jgi:hypothetical protein
LEGCKILATVQIALAEKYQGNTNAKGYKKEATTWVVSVGVTKQQFRKDVAVGRHLLEHGDNPALKTKTDIYKSLQPAKASKPKEPKAPVAPVVTTVDPYWKECERKYMALMDYMGDRADKILAAALAQADQAVAAD